MTLILVLARKRPVTRMISLIASPVFVLLGTYAAFVGIRSESVFVGLVGTAALVLGILGPIWERRYRLVVTDEYVELRAFRTHKISYDEVREVNIEHYNVRLFADRERITISGDITDREMALQTIADRLKVVPNAMYTGHVNSTSGFFGITKERK